ncbi:hypothetical protein KV564_17710 [Paenibacillus chitinolyticus]|nr:hypothetical protein [Paenibacillus chitinolyticus]
MKIVEIMNRRKDRLLETVLQVLQYRKIELQNCKVDVRQIDSLGQPVRIKLGQKKIKGESR